MPIMPTNEELAKEVEDIAEQVSLRLHKVVQELRRPKPEPGEPSRSSHYS